MRAAHTVASSHPRSPPYHIALDRPPAEVGAGAGAAGDDTAMARGIEQTLAEVWPPSPIISVVLTWCSSLLGHAQLLSVNDKMNRCAATSRTKASSAMLKVRPCLLIVLLGYKLACRTYHPLQTLQRNREILHDYKTEFRTIQVSPHKPCACLTLHQLHKTFSHHFIITLLTRIAG